MASPEAGAILPRYRLVDTIGEGGTGRIRRAVDTRLDELRERQRWSHGPRVFSGWTPAEPGRIEPAIDEVERSPAERDLPVVLAGLPVSDPYRDHPRLRARVESLRTA